MFFNESIKLRKLQSLRNIKMKFNRTKTYIKNKLEKSSEKCPDSKINAKFSPLKIVSKTTPSPLKLKAEMRRMESESNDNSPIKLKETIRISNDETQDMKGKIDEKDQNKIVEILNHNILCK